MVPVPSACRPSHSHSFCTWKEPLSFSLPPRTYPAFPFTAITGSSCPQEAGKARSSGCLILPMARPVPSSTSSQTQHQVPRGERPRQDPCQALSEVSPDRSHICIHYERIPEYLLYSIVSVWEMLSLRTVETKMEFFRTNVYLKN